MQTEGSFVEFDGSHSGHFAYGGEIQSMDDDLT